MNLGLSRTDKNTSMRISSLTVTHNLPCREMWLLLCLWFIFGVLQRSAGVRTRWDSPGSHSCVWCSAKGGGCSCPGEFFPLGHKQTMRSWFLLHGSSSPPPSHPTRKASMCLFSIGGSHILQSKRGLPSPVWPWIVLPVKTGLFRKPCRWLTRHLLHFDVCKNALLLFNHTSLLSCKREVAATLECPLRYTLT